VFEVGAQQKAAVAELEAGGGPQWLDTGRVTHECCRTFGAGVCFIRKRGFLRPASRIVVTPAYMRSTRSGLNVLSRSGCGLMGLIHRSVQKVMTCRC